VQTFDMGQTNNILTGVGLACEIVADSEKNRAFVKVQAIDKQKHINKANPDSARFT
jgi:hypothetical protein